MKNKKTLSLVAGIFIILFIIYVYTFLNKSEKTCDINTINESIINYVKNNISQISPEKEVLGGKFYLNKINFIGNNSAVVEYEDGHILLRATFDYNVMCNKESYTYGVNIINFKIIK